MGRPLVFALNGEREELAAVDPRTTLLQYIRSKVNLQGTKLGCGEGGCGACTVLLSKYDPSSKRVDEFTINSCLALLCSIDGCAVTTTEGLKNASKNDYHAVHKRLAGFHASQCGFCTPGMSMSIYGGLRKACAGAKSRVGQSSNGSSDGRVPITALDATSSISGNICRCTGYRPILDACKSFSADVDVEDLGLNSFWASKQKADAALLPPYNPEEDPQFPSFLINELESRSRETSPPSALSFCHEEGREAKAKREWITAASLTNAFELINTYGIGNPDVQLTVGNTSSGVYKHIRPQVYIDIAHIPELQVVKASRESLEVGAGIALSKLIDLLEGESYHGSAVFKELAKHVRQIATEQVRNRASLGGNLILAQKLGFDSDLATILVGAGAELTLVSAEGQSSLPIEEFLPQGRVEPGRILISVRIPTWNNDLPRASKLFFKTYRISCRPRGNAVSYINSAFLAVVDENSQVISSVKLAFGAFGGPHAIRAEKTEKFLVGKSVSPAVLLEAIKTLKEEINPPPTVHKSTYRRSVAVGFFFDFFNSFLLASDSQVAIPLDEEQELDDEVSDVHMSAENGAPSHPKSSSQSPALSNGSASKGPALSNCAVSNGKASSNGDANSEPTNVVEFGVRSKRKTVTRNSEISTTGSSQKFVASREFWPVAEPTEKTGAQLQASGEAVYVDDIAPVRGTLYAAFVLSSRRPGRILSIDTSEALKSPGAVDFVSVKDIPGKNVGFDLFFCDDRLFADEKVECLNDTIGLLVADSYENAREAASKVKVNIEEEEGCVYTIEEAIAKESYGDLGMIFAKSGSISIGEEMVKGDHRIEGEVYCGSQYPFYMETQTAYAIPDEDECVTVYSANQGPSGVQKAVALALGIPMNNVRIITRRLGGGFGGKWTKASMVAVASAVAARKLKRPVRISLDRLTDMRMSSGRHEAKALYTVDFNDDGKVKGLTANVFLNSGRAKEISPLVIHGVMVCLRQYNWEFLRAEAKLCKTDHVSRGIMRGPGNVQGHFIAETIIEHVAAYLGIEAGKVRERNMHSLESVGKFFPTTTNSVDFYALPSIWQKLKDQSQFEKRKLAVRKFNQINRWDKKGIDVVMGIYSTGHLSRQARVSVCEDGSVVVEVGGIEMGQGLWTKVKQAVSFGLNQLWGPKAHPLESVDISRIRVVQNDSLSLPNSKTTGGSTTSEASCQAAILACEKLVESLKPFLDTLRQGGVTPALWEAIIGTANFASASLTAQGNYTSAGRSEYLNFGACVSEVSINVLTGATTILQSDLIYDCGRSLNPAVDVGQIEGAFVMGVGFYLTEELRMEEGALISTGTWDYKPPIADNIPQRFHVELSHSKANKNRILSSKASGEPPILLAKSVHSAVRNAIAAAREDNLHLSSVEAHGMANGGKANGMANGGMANGGNANGMPNGGKANAFFRLDSPASIDVVKTLCGLDNVERYLESLG